LERLAARAGDGDINVFWVNSWFHVLTLYRRRPGRDFKRDMIGEGAWIVKFAGDFSRSGAAAQRRRLLSLLALRRRAAA
jgi:hypothetical protein